MNTAEVTNRLLIVLISVICIAFLFLLNDGFKKQEQFELVYKELQENNKELEKLKNELRDNDNILLKVMEKEW